MTGRKEGLPRITLAAGSKARREGFQVRRGESRSVQRLEPVQIGDRRQRLAKALRDGTKADFQHLQKGSVQGMYLSLVASLHTSFLMAFLTKTVCECHGELG